MDIEEVAARSPEKILKVYIDPMIGFQPFLGRRLAFGLNLEAEQVRPMGQLIGNLFRMFGEQDASLVEINPLMITRDALGIEDQDYYKSWMD